MATTTISGSTVVFSNSTAAADLSTSIDENASSYQYSFDVLDASGGGTKTIVYSVDDGDVDNAFLGTLSNNFVNYDTDLLTKDAAGITWQLGGDTSELGAHVWIGTDNEVHYDASNLSGTINHLGVGESLTDTFDYTIRMSNGTLSVGHLSVNLIGENDAAVITAGTNTAGPNDGPFTAVGVTEDASAIFPLTEGITESVTGTLAFTDADWHDTHTIGDVVAAGDLGTLTATVHTDTATVDGTYGAGNTYGSGNLATGEIDLSYSVDDSAINYLGQGETKTDSFTVNLVEHHPGDGSTTIDPITVSYTITGTNDAAVITEGTNTTGTTGDAHQYGPFTAVGVTENASGGDDVTGVESASPATLAFTDADWHDTHTIGDVVNADGDLGTLTATVHTDTATVDGTYGAGNTYGSDNMATGEIDLSYSVDDSAINHLGQGETATDTFTVNLVEHHVDGSITVDPTMVSYTITGTDDPAVFSDYAALGTTDGHTVATVTDSGTSDTTSPGPFHADGSLSFTDVDTNDTHTTALSTIQGTYGTLTLDPVTESNGSGSFDWHYTVTDTNIDGIHADDTFDVVLNDYSSVDGWVSQTDETVTIHLNGTTDVTSHALTGIVFDPTQTGNDLTAPNFGHFQAVDPDGDTSFTYSLVGSTTGNGVAIDASTGDLSFSGSGGFSGTVTVGATDAGGDSGQQTFNIIVGSNSVADNLSATTGNTILAGQGQGDTLTGSSGVDYILGGGGDDIITGNGGADVLMGGGGKDHFVFAAASDSTHAAFDTILDFTAGTDKISFTNGLVTTVDTTFNAATLAAGHVEWTQSGTNATIYANTGTGNESVTVGADVMEIHLTGVTGTISSGDFIHS